MAAPRHITRFVSRDGSTVVMLPMDRAETESTQELRTALAPGLGMDYAVDQLGAMPAPKGVGNERLRAVLYGATGAAVDTQADALRSQIQSIGQGRLWSEGGDGTERWARARAERMPDLTVSYESMFTQPVSVEFLRLSDWFAETPTVVTQTLAGSPATVNVTNDGDADAREIVIEIAALGASGFVNPSITNVLTGETFTIARTAGSSAHRLRIDCGNYAVTRSTDSGSSWANEYVNLTVGSTQVGFMRLIPGSQSLTVTGCTNATITVTFSATWH
ncbi:MAG TPA: phage tail family protein [Nitrospira sp.]|nr:phage tail family protein [Nitrospira sp.]HQW88750.1 phage tail family protein [Nitrospira sp.]HQZ90462.1 phage tail family protein [Thermomicrobiales bacterium]HRA32644.1 phage tail family protein [Thermomicrobiales bacterium]